MTDSEIKHFLVVADPEKPTADVRMLGSDYEVAVAAYGEAEEQFRGTHVEVVLLSADSIETVRRTHSSYFTVPEVDPIDQLLSAAV